MGQDITVIQSYRSKGRLPSSWKHAVMGDFGILHVMSLVFYLARGECRT